MSGEYDYSRPLPSFEEATALAEHVTAEVTRLRGSASALRSINGSMGIKREGADRVVERIERDAARMQRVADILVWVARRADRLHELNRPRLQPVPSSVRR